MKGHTPTPWFWNGYSGIFSVVCDVTGIPYCWRDGHNDGENAHDEFACTPFIGSVQADYGDTAIGRNAVNAQFIVAAVNAYESLLAAARAVVRYHRRNEPDGPFLIDTEWFQPLCAAVEAMGQEEE